MVVILERNWQVRTILQYITYIATFWGETLSELKSNFMTITENSFKNFNNTCSYRLKFVIHFRFAWCSQIFHMSTVAMHIISGLHVCCTALFQWRPSSIIDSLCIKKPIFYKAFNCLTTQQTTTFSLRKVSSTPILNLYLY